MEKKEVAAFLIFILLVGVLFLLSRDVLAQLGGVGSSDLAGRISGLTEKMLTLILPAISILGLVYAAILAATGDQSAKQRMILILIASVIGFMAPVIIRWLQSIVSVRGII
ncbi:MAG: hypothetical protein OXB88_10140 [Bacteriovoracales bacterium]|nr:hypothetical protein [Bacteriovoracales bacterium]